MTVWLTRLAAGLVTGILALGPAAAQQANSPRDRYPTVVPTAPIAPGFPATPPTPPLGQKPIPTWGTLGQPYLAPSWGTIGGQGGTARTW